MLSDLASSDNLMMMMDKTVAKYGQLCRDHNLMMMSCLLLHCGQSVEFLFCDRMHLLVFNGLKKAFMYMYYTL